MINFSNAAIKRIGAARAILEAVKAEQTKDGASGISEDMKMEFGYYVDLLRHDGFIRQINVTDDAFQYRITWKGIAFLDLLKIYDDVKETEPPDSLKAFIIQQMLFSFH